MAHSTKRFTLTRAAYQDISEGSAVCSFRLPYRGHRGGGIRIHLGTGVPSAATADYDLFIPPVPGSEETMPSVASFTALSSLERVYASAADDGDSVILVAYRR